MLDPWIIEEIKRRERQKDEQRPSVVVELPIQGPEGRDRDRKPRPETEDPPRGVTIIDYGIACW